LALGTWHLALGTWHLALGTWHLALGTWTWTCVGVKTTHTIKKTSVLNVKNP
jgi:hypothetical protein